MSPASKSIKLLLSLELAGCQHLTRLALKRISSVVVSEPSPSGHRQGCGGSAFGNFDELPGKCQGWAGLQGPCGEAKLPQCHRVCLAAQQAASSLLGFAFALQTGARQQCSVWVLHLARVGASPRSSGGQGHCWGSARGGQRLKHNQRWPRVQAAELCPGAAPRSCSKVRFVCSDLGPHPGRAAAVGAVQGLLWLLQARTHEDAQIAAAPLL